MNDCKCSSDLPEFYDPELAKERMKLRDVVLKLDARTEEEQELVKRMAAKLTENLKKGRVSWV